MAKYVNRGGRIARCFSIGDGLLEVQGTKREEKRSANGPPKISRPGLSAYRRLI